MPLVTVGSDSTVHDGERWRYWTVVRPPSPPPPRSSAPLTLLAVCDVTLKINDSHAVSLGVALLCFVCGHARVVE